MASAGTGTDGDVASGGSELDAALHEVAALKAQLAAAQERVARAADRAETVARAAAEDAASQVGA